MALILLASVKGSPGVTTACLALAATWPVPSLIAELDPDGGDIRYRLRTAEGGPLGTEPGLLSFAAAADPDAGLHDHTAELPGGLRLLVGLPGAYEAVAMTERWAAVGERLRAHRDGDVLADCGRLGAYSPLVQLFPHAAGLVVVTRPTVDAVGHLRSRLEGLEGLPPVFVIVVTGAADRHSARQIQAILAGARLPATVVGSLAYDPVGAGTLAGEWSGRLERTPLMRSARDVARQLGRDLAGSAVGPRR